MTYLGQRGYTIEKKNLTIQEQERIRDSLMVVPFVPKSSLSRPSKFPVYRESPNKFYVPRFYGIDNFGEPNKALSREPINIDVPFSGTLRPDQLPVVKSFMYHVKKSGCGLLELYCGYGKTVCALSIVSQLGKKTLIVVHKEFLLSQWVERINQFLPNARVGRIQGTIIDIEDKDIVIGMLQSLSMKDYPCSLFRDFGLTVVDECHHISAEVFSNALFKVVTPYMLGLSATMKRKDGLSKVFKMFLGDVVVKKTRAFENEVRVKAIEFRTDDPDFNKDELNFRGQIHYALMIKKLCEFQERRDFIMKVIKDTVNEEDLSNQIIVLAHNKNVLVYLYDAIQEDEVATVGFYIGRMKQDELKKSESKEIILATYAMAEEALDIKTLTTLIMVTPKTDVTQAIGRIMRSKDAKPLIIDIVDVHPVFKRQWSKRKSYYNKNNYSISYTDDYHKGAWEKLGLEKQLTKDLFLQGECLV
jgi:superfamily II DNA or RNA helicase